MIRNILAPSSGGVTFDFYISTTGNDANPGTLAFPWAITSCQSTNSNNALMAGKRVGFLNGTYDVSGFAADATSGCKLTPPSGSLGASTTWSAVNSQATIIVSDPNVGGYVQAPVIGNGGNPPSASNNPHDITIFGFEITANGNLPPAAGNNDGISFGNGNTSGGHGAGTGILIDSCHIHGFQNNTGSVNIGCIFMAPGMYQWKVRNCYLHDCWQSNAGRYSHANASGVHDDVGQGIIEYCTIHSCNNGVYEKNNSSIPQGLTIRYCYMYGGAGMGCWIAGFNNATGSAPPYAATNIYNCVLENVGPYAQANSAPDNLQAPMNTYNLTAYIDSSEAGSFKSLGYFGVGPTTGAPWNFASFYNNVVYYASSTSVDTSIGIYDYGPTSADKTIVDFNCYFSASGSTIRLGIGTTMSSASVTTSTFAAWQALSGTPDTHSLAASDPLMQFELSAWSSAAGTAQYKLQGTSPCKGAGQSGVDMGAWGGTDVNTGTAISKIGSILP